MLILFKICNKYLIIKIKNIINKKIKIFKMKIIKTNFSKYKVLVSNRTRNKLLIIIYMINYLILRHQNKLIKNSIM